MDRELDLGFRRKRMARRAVFGSGVMLVGWAVFFELPHWLRPSVERSRLRTAVVERGVVEATVNASGTVVAAFEKVISSPVEARVLHVLKRPGAVLRRGDAILELDVSASRLDLERLDQRLSQKLNEKDQLHLQLEEDRRDLASRIELKKLDQQILDYRAEQSRKLSGEGLISDTALRQAEVEASKGRIEISQLVESVATARGKTEARLAGIQMEVSIFEKERAEAARQLELATTRADRDGVLTWAVPEEGATVHRGDVVARIADLTTFKVHATVSDVHASRLRPGLSVKVRLDDLELPGVLSSVDPTIENGTIKFNVDLQNGSHPKLRNNLRVDVLIVTGRRENALRLPRGPFAEGEGRQEVFVLRGGRGHRTTARFGLSGFDHLEVADGLEAGDEVVISDMKEYLHLAEIDLR